jgi:hypothetical protein
MIWTATGYHDRDQAGAANDGVPASVLAPEGEEGDAAGEAGTDAEGTDAEGTDAEGGDAEGSDAEGSDGEGSDAEGTDGGG